MLRSGAKGNTHAERLDNFYSGQAKGYDDFRKRLLKGREELWAALANPEIGGGVPEGGVWVDFGGGTGANLERFAEEDRKKLKKIYVVDLAHSLLEVCNQRIADKFTDENGNNMVNGNAVTLNLNTFVQGSNVNGTITLPMTLASGKYNVNLFYSTSSTSDMIAYGTAPGKLEVVGHLAKYNAPFNIHDVTTTIDYLLAGTKPGLNISDVTELIDHLLASSNN